MCKGTWDWVCQVQKRKGNLLNYIIFLRVTPLLPNIFINIASPVVNVPITPFALGEYFFSAHVQNFPVYTLKFGHSVAAFVGFDRWKCFINVLTDGSASMMVYQGIEGLIRRHSDWLPA